MKESVIEKETINTGLIKGILLLTAFFAMLNETSVNVALKNFMDVFNISVSTAQWLISGFMLIMTIVVPVTAFIIKSFSTRKIYFTSMYLLIVGTLLSGLATTFSILLVGRLVQATGTCVLMSLLINSMLVLTPPQKRGGAMGMVGLVALFAPAISPTLAGIVIQIFGWRWIFLGLLPILIMLLLIAMNNLKNVTEPIAGKIDVISIILSIVAFGGILAGISGVGENGKVNITTLTPLLVGVVFLILFIWRQLTIKDPLLELRVFKNPMYAFGMIMIFFSLMTIFGIVLLVPMFLQGALGITASVAGLIMLPGGMLNGIASPLVGRLYDKFGPKPFVILGALLMMVVCLGLSFIDSKISIGTFISLHCLILISAAMIMTTSQANGLNQLPHSLYPHGTAIMSTLMQLAGGLGSAVYIMLLSINQHKYLETSSEAGDTLNKNALIYGFNQTFKVAAMILIINFIISLFVKRSIAKSEHN